MVPTIDCTKDLGHGGVADLFIKPVAITSLNDSTRCDFKTASGGLVLVYVIQNSAQDWDSLKGMMSSTTPLAGIGDKATYSESPQGIDLAAAKGPLICYASIKGWGSIVKNDMSNLRGGRAKARHVVHEAVRALSCDRVACVRGDR